MLGQISGGSLNAQIKLANKAFSSQSAQQMLIYYYNAASGGVNKSHEDKDHLFSDLDHMGNYPIYCKIVALSQGSISGEKQIDEFSSSPAYRTPNDYLLDFSFDSYAWVLGLKFKFVGASLEAKTNANYTSSTLYNANWGMYSIGIQVKWIGINITTGYIPIYNQTKGGYTMSTCTSPGGTYGQGLDSYLKNYSHGGGFSGNNWITNIFNARTSIDGDGCAVMEGHVGWKGFFSGHFDYTYCTDGFKFCFVPTLSALDYGESLDQFQLDHDIAADANKYNLMNTAVITGIHPYDPDYSKSYPYDEYNRPHTGDLYYYGPYKNDQIFDLRFPDPPYSEKYYSCKTQSSPAVLRPRGFLNLEIGDEEIYLENYILGIDAIYRTEYDINVNVRNPYYNYNGIDVDNDPNVPIKGIYSKTEDFDILSTAHATFMVDQTNSPNNPPGGGLNYVPSGGENGPYTVVDVPMGVCCNVFPNSATARLAKSEPVSKDLISTNFLDIFPNPGDGKKLNIRLKMLNSDAATIRIFNSLGQLINEDNLKIHIGMNTIQFNNLAALRKSGLYIMKVVGNAETLEKKFIIE